MNLNVASQNNGLLAYTGINAAAVAPAIDIRHHIHFAFTFQVKAAIAADAIFEIQAAPASAGDPCVPGAFVAVPEVPICSDYAVPAANSRITIPAGTPIGSICTGTLPCRPDAFLKVVAVSGTTDSVTVVATLGGPK